MDSLAVDNECAASANLLTNISKLISSRLHQSIWQTSNKNQPTPSPNSLIPTYFFGGQINSMTVTYFKCGVAVARTKDEVSDHPNASFISFS